MTVTQQQLEQAMAEAIGNPTSGILRDTLPTLAAAAYATINPTSEKENRIIPTTETRTTLEA